MKPARSRVQLPLWISASAAFGLIATVAVSWACLLWARFPMHRAARESELRWSTAVPEDWPPKPTRSTVGESIAVRSETAIAEVPETNDLPWQGFALDSTDAGFPWPSMRVESWTKGGAAGATWSRQTGILLPRWWPWQPDSNDGYYLPATPVWPWFAVDTATYSVAFLGLVGVCRQGRRVQRRRRGLCVHCAYCLSGLPEFASCPECGR